MLKIQAAKFLPKAVSERCAAKWSPINKSTRFSGEYAWLVDDGGDFNCGQDDMTTYRDDRAGRGIQTITLDVPRNLGAAFRALALLVRDGMSIVEAVEALKAAPSSWQPMSPARKRKLVEARTKLDERGVIAAEGTQVDTRVRKSQQTNPAKAAPPEHLLLKAKLKEAQMQLAASQSEIHDCVESIRCFRESDAALRRDLETVSGSLTEARRELYALEPFRALTPSARSSLANVATALKAKIGFKKVFFMAAGVQSSLVPEVLSYCQRLEARSAEKQGWMQWIPRLKG